MLKLYKTIGDEKTVEIESIEHGCWIDLVNPDEAEINMISKETGLSMDLLKIALDEEESSRIEIEEGQICVVLDIPVMNTENKSVQYYTIPLGIILNDKVIVTVCLQENRVINDLIYNRIKTFYTFKKSRFILQVLYRVATYYLIYLKQIDKTSHTIEARLHKSLKNKELIQLLSLEKSLVYFSTSLKSNEVMFEKMMKLDLVQKYEDDRELLEDVIIENRQAIEMANIYSNILSGTMDAFASLISNNLNIVMKFLASITIVLSIPTAVSGFFGMNVPVPFRDNPFGFSIILGITFSIVVVVVYFLAKKDMF